MMEDNNKNPNYSEYENKPFSKSDREETESSVDLKFLLYLLIQYKYWIIASVIVCVIAGLAYLHFCTPTYTAYAKILVKETDKKSRYSSSLSNTFADLGFMNNSNGFDNEVEILSTRTLNKKVVRDLKLYTTYFQQGRLKKREVYGKRAPYQLDMDEASLDSLDRILKFHLSLDDRHNLVVDIKYKLYGEKREQHKVLTALPAVIHTPFGAVYVSKNQLVEDYVDKVRGHTDFEDPFLLKREIDVRIVPLDFITSYYVSEIETEATSKQTTIALVTMNDNIPERAQDYMTRLCEIYNEEANADNNIEAQRTADFIDERLGIISKELNLTEGELEQYKRNSGVVDVASDAKVDLTQSLEYENQLVEVQIQSNLVNSLRDFVNRNANSLKVIPSNIGLKDQTLTQMVAQYNQLVMERDDLLRSMSETSPQVTTLTSQLEGLMNGIKSSLNSLHHQLAMQQQRLQGQQDKYSSRISSSPGKERALADITRQQEVKAGLYLMLLQKREENAITMASNAYKGKLIEEPIVSPRPVSPRRGIVLLISAVVGFLLPFGYYYVRQFLRYRIDGRDDLSRLLPGIPLLGTIPEIKSLKNSTRVVVVKENRNSLIVEAYRALRSNLPFVLSKGKNVILFTSSEAGEGKTSIACNLGTSISFTGKRVLLIGLDIRKPRLASLFDLSDIETGISSYLAHDVEDVDYLDSMIQPSGISPNLFILPAGPIPPNPAELLERDNLRVAIEHLKTKFDFVLLDTAPVGLVSDTISIAKLADLSLYVVRSNYTLKADCGLINEIYSESRLPNMNLILNADREGKQSASYRYGYGYYGGHHHGYGYGYGYVYGYGHSYGSYYGMKDGEKLEEI